MRAGLDWTVYIICRSNDGLDLDCLQIMSLKWCLDMSRLRTTSVTLFVLDLDDEAVEVVLAGPAQALDPTISHHSVTSSRAFESDHQWE
jgi:hypothetical protein